ncbi:MAG TPA: hypothetical protein VNA26_02800 [Chitinophagaceae bacterium]|nr:hypothetical protein [Chitinophagaceae bacterium]
MEKYLDLSGESGVIAYEIGGTWIKVKFKFGTVYTYSYRQPGKKHVEEMKKLAKEGRDLASYISQNVKKAYESVEG